MKKMIFEVKKNENFSLAALLENTNKLPCNMEHNFKDGIVEVEGATPELIDSISDMIDSNYTVDKLDILNMEDPKVAENSYKINSDFSESDISPFIIKKVNELIKLIQETSKNNPGIATEIEDVIESTKSLLTMRYKTTEILNAEIGDIVQCNFGDGLKGEIYGRYVTAVVVEKPFHNMVLVVPLCKDNGTTYPGSIPYTHLDGTEKTKRVALYSKSRLFRIERINVIKGSVTPEYLNKIQEATAAFYSSSGKFVDSKSEKTTYSNTKKSAKITKKALGKEEIALLQIIEQDLTKVNQNTDINTFLKSIDFITTNETHNKWIEAAFSSALEISKITLENIVQKVNESFPEAKSEEIKNTFREVFKNWLEQYSEKRDFRISFTAILKLFKEYHNKN